MCEVKFTVAGIGRLLPVATSLLGLGLFVICCTAAAHSQVTPQAGHNRIRRRLRWKVDENNFRSPARFATERMQPEAAELTWCGQRWWPMTKRATRSVK
jgi:hypothetical protein